MFGASLRVGGKVEDWLDGRCRVSVGGNPGARRCIVEAEVEMSAEIRRDGEIGVKLLLLLWCLWQTTLID